VTICVLALGCEHRLKEAKDGGELTPDADVRAATLFLMATLAGIKVSAKGGADAKALRSIAAFAMRSLMASAAKTAAVKKPRVSR
jgi:hypothetical protein